MARRKKGGHPGDRRPQDNGGPKKRRLFGRSREKERGLVVGQRVQVTLTSLPGIQIRGMASSDGVVERLNADGTIRVRLTGIVVAGQNVIDVQPNQVRPE